MASVFSSGRISPADTKSMVECYQCHTPLIGSWRMTSADQAYEKTGRFLGVQNGYFLFDGEPDWVFCYCQSCWQTQVLALPFVKKLSQQIATLQQQTASFQLQVTNLQQAQATLQQEKLALQQEKATLQQEKATLQQTTDANAAALQQQLNSCLATSRILDDLLAQSGAGGLKTLLAGLSSDQIQVLRTYSQFDFTFEQKLLQDQLASAKATTSDAVGRLKMSTINIVTAKKEELSTKRQAHEKTVLNCTEAKVPEAVMSEMMRAFNSHLVEVEASIEAWDTFRTNLDSLEIEDVPEPPELHLPVIEKVTAVKMHLAE